MTFLPARFKTITLGYICNFDDLSLNRVPKGVTAHSEQRFEAGTPNALVRSVQFLCSFTLPSNTVTASLQQSVIHKASKC
jgi:hypothetical protein